MKISTHLITALVFGTTAFAFALNPGLAIATLAAAGVLTLAVRDYSGRRFSESRLAA